MVLLIWICCIVLATSIGARKRQPVGAFFWGLFLGPVGLIVVAAWPDRRWQCPHCLSRIAPGSTRCRYCAGEIGNPPTAEHFSGSYAEWRRQHPAR